MFDRQQGLVRACEAIGRQHMPNWEVDPPPADLAMATHRRVGSNLVQRIHGRVEAATSPLEEAGSEGDDSDFVFEGLVV